MTANNLGNKIPHKSILVLINEYNTEKHNFREKFEDIDKKIPEVSSLVATTVLNTKIGEVGDKIPSDLVN